MVRAFQKGDSTQAPSSEVARVASSIKMKDAKKFASTKHKGLPEKKVKKESVEHVGNSDFRSSAEFMNTFAKLKRLRKKNDKIGTGNTGLPQGVAQTNRRGKMQGVEEAAIGTAAGGGAVTGSTSYTGPNKADRKVIKKMDNKKFAAKLADYEKNMDPKKREALKDKATKGMKFTHEGTSYGLYKGDGKPKMQFAAFVKKVKPPETKKKSKLKKEETEVYWSSKALDQLDELSKKTMGSYVKKASTDMAIGAVKGDKDKVTKRHSGILKATDKITKEEVEVLDERQKDSDNQRLSQERGRSNYGKASIRNVRHTGEGGNAADPAERLVAMDKRHKAHKEKRGVKTLSKYKKVVKEEGYDHYRDKKLEQGTWKEPERKNPPRKPMSKADRKKSQDNSMKVLDMVKAGIRQKYGKGAIMGESFINEETPMQRIDRISKEKVAARAKAAAADKAKKDASAAKFQAHKKATLAKGGRPVDALDSWQKKKLNKEELLSFSQWLAEGNDRTRMMNKAKNQTTGSISADRDTKSEKDNRSNRKGLEKDLKKKGIGYKKSVGKYKYDSGETGKEVSYQTSPGKNMSKRRFGKVMRRLGRKYDQESVITKKAGKDAKLHDTTTKQNKKQPKGYKPFSLGSKVKKGKNPTGEGETSATKVRGGKMPSKTKKNSTYHYGK